MNANASHPTSVTRDGAPQASPILSAAQRQRQYRERRKRAVTDAIGQEDQASRVTLLILLGSDLAALEAHSTSASMIEARRDSARRVLNTLVTRYGLEL